MNLSGGQPGGAGRRRYLSVCCFLTLIGISLILATSLIQPSDGAALNPVGTKSRTNKDRGCYYMLQHYKNGEQIKTDEPCLNCTCENSMLMCYLRVCPYVKPMGDRCIVERVPGECCPKITCSDVTPPVDGLEQQVEPETVAPPLSDTIGSNGTTVNNFDIALTNASDVGTGASGCTLNGNYYHEGALLPTDPKKPCEICYCINGSSACVLQECALEVNGCAPIYQSGGCCPTRYNCTTSATGQKRVSPAANRRKFWENFTGFGSPTSTTKLPESHEVLSFSTSTTAKPMIFPNFGRDSEKPTASGCRAANSTKVYTDGERVPSRNKCEHCYCMRNEIVCAVQECKPPCDGCTPIYEDDKDCCPKRYECVAPTQRVPTDNIIDAQPETTTPLSSVEHSASPGIISASVNLEITPEPKPAPTGENPISTSAPQGPSSETQKEPQSPLLEGSTPVPLPTSMDPAKAEISVMTTRQTNSPLRPISPKLSGEDEGPAEPMSSDQESTNASKPESRESTNVDGFSLNGEREQETDLSKSAGRFVAPEGSMVPYANQGQDANEVIPPALTSTIAPPTTIRDVGDATNESGPAKSVEVQNSDKKMRPQVIPSIIPGEGSCRYNGRLYSNGQEVKSKDNCMEICMCINSVVYCDEVDCPKGPADQDCKRVVVEGECCPKYVCDEADETTPSKTEPAEVAAPSAAPQQPTDQATGQKSSDQPAIQSSGSTQGPAETASTEDPSPTTIETLIKKDEASSETVPSPPIPTTDSAVGTISGDGVPKVDVTPKPEQAPTSHDLAQSAESATSTTTTASGLPQTPITSETGTAREGQPESVLPTMTTTTITPSASQTQSTSGDNSGAASAREGQPELALPATTMSVSDASSTTQSSVNKEVKDTNVADVMASSPAPEIKETSPPTSITVSSSDSQEKATSIPAEQASFNEVKPTSEIQPDAPLTPKQAEDTTTRAQEPTTASSFVPVTEITQSPTTGAPVDPEPKVASDTANLSPELNTITSSDSATTSQASEATSTAAPVSEATSPVAITEAPPATTTTTTTTTAAASAAEQTTKLIEDLAKAAEAPSTGSESSPQPTVVAETTTPTPIDKSTQQAISETSTSRMQPGSDESARSDNGSSASNVDLTTKPTVPETFKATDPQSSTPESPPTTASVVENTTTAAASSEKSIEQTEAPITVSAAPDAGLETEAPAKSETISTTENTEPANVASAKVDDLPISSESITTTSQPQATDVSSPSSPQAQQEILSMPTTTNLTLGENLVATNVAREGEPGLGQAIPSVSSVETTSTILPPSSQENSTYINSGDIASSSPVPESKDLATPVSPLTDGSQDAVSSTTETPLTSEAKSAIEVSSDATLAPKQVEAITPIIDQTTRPAATEISSISLAESTPSATSSGPADTEPKVASDTVNLSPELNTITSGESTTTPAPVDASPSSSAAPMSESTIKPEQAPTSYDLVQPTESATPTTTTTTTTATEPSSTQTQTISEAGTVRERQPESALPTTTIAVPDTSSATQSSMGTDVMDANAADVIASSPAPETKEILAPTTSASASLPEAQDESSPVSTEQLSSNGVKPTGEVFPEAPLSPKQAEDSTTRAQDLVTGQPSTEPTTASSSASDSVSTLSPQEEVATDIVNAPPIAPVIDQTTRPETIGISSVPPSESTSFPTSSAPIDTEPKIAVELVNPSPELNTITSSDSATTSQASEATSTAAPVSEATSPVAITEAPPATTTTTTTTTAAASAAEQTTKLIEDLAKAAEVTSSSGSSYQPEPPVVAETTTVTPVDRTTAPSVASSNEVPASSVQQGIDASARSEDISTSTSSEPATKLVEPETTKPIELQSSSQESTPSAAVVTETTTTSSVSSEKSVERTESQTTTSSTSIVPVETEAPAKSDLASTVTGIETPDTPAIKANDLVPESITTTSQPQATDVSSPSSPQAQQEILSMPTTTNLTLGENLVATNVAREGEPGLGQAIPSVSSVETTSTISPDSSTSVKSGDSSSVPPQPEFKDLTTQSSPPSIGSQDVVSSVASETTSTESAVKVSPDTTLAPQQVEVVTPVIDQTTSPAPSEATTDFSSVTPSATSSGPADTEPKVASDTVNLSPELNTITSGESTTTPAPVDASPSSSAAPMSESTIKPEQAPTSYDLVQPTESATPTTTTTTTTPSAAQTQSTSGDNSGAASAREGQPELALPATTMSVSDASSTTQSSNAKSADDMSEGPMSASPIPELKETLAATTSASTSPPVPPEEATSISPEQANTNEVKPAGESSPEAPLNPKQAEEATTRAQDFTTGQPPNEPTTASSSVSDSVSTPQEKGATDNVNLSPELNTITSSDSATTSQASEATSTVAPVSEATSPVAITDAPSTTTTTAAAAAAAEQTTKLIEDLAKAAETPSTGSESSPQPTVVETTTATPVAKSTQQAISENSVSSSQPATEAPARSEDVSSTLSADQSTKTAEQGTTKATEPQANAPESTPSAAVESTTVSAAPYEKSVEQTEPQTTVSVASSNQPSTEIYASSKEAESTTTVTPKPETTSAVQEQSSSINQEAKSASSPASTERPVDLTDSLIGVARADPNFDTSTAMPEIKATPSPADEFLAGISTANGSSFKPVEITTVLPSIRGQSTPITIPWSHIANTSQPETTTANIPVEQPTTFGFSNYTQGVKSISHEPTQSSVGVSESDYEELSEEPGCEYEGKTYNSAQQIPRSHPCDFCFCFRGDIICLQQTCPPPVPHCFESVMDGFCCPRYECPVHTVRSSPNSTSLSLTPFESHSQLQAANDPQSSEPRQLGLVARGSSVKGCFVDNKLYGVGQNIVSASGPCLECKCDKSGMMKCNPKECTPEDPLLQQINREVLQSTLSRSQVR